MGEPFDWTELPAPALGRVLEHLHAAPLHQGSAALAAMRLACSAWREAVDASLDMLHLRDKAAAAPSRGALPWRGLRKVCLERCNAPPELLTQLAGGGQLTKLALLAPAGRLLPGHVRQLAAAAASLRSLELVDVALGPAPDLRPLAACTHLEVFTLELDSAEDLTADVQALAAACPALRRLSLYRCVRAFPRLAQQPFDLSRRAATLTALRLSGSFTTDAGWQQLLQRLPALARLDLSVSPGLGDAGLLAVAALAPTLTALRLQGDGLATPDGLAAALAALPLRSLEVRWCHQPLDRSFIPLIGLKLMQASLGRQLQAADLLLSQHHGIIPQTPKCTSPLLS